MSQHFFERPILNSSYGFLGRHCELDAEGQPTNRIGCGSRSQARPAGSQVLGPYKRARTNVRGSDFSSLYLKQDASRYLSQLQSVADDLPGLLSSSNRIAFQRKNRLSTPASRRSTWLVTQKCSQARRLILTLFTSSTASGKRIISR